MPVMPDDEPFDYLATQAIADFLATETNPALDGLLYPSVQGSQGKLNVVLFHNAARVQELDLPKGAEIYAHLSHDTEDGPEIDYWVFEEVPPEVPSLPSEAHHLPFMSDPLDASHPDFDERAHLSWTFPA
jgi:RES domain-containing protein